MNGDHFPKRDAFHRDLDRLRGVFYDVDALDRLQKLSPRPDNERGMALIVRVDVHGKEIRPADDRLRPFDRVALALRIAHADHGRRQPRHFHDEVAVGFFHGIYARGIRHSIAVDFYLRRALHT